MAGANTSIKALRALMRNPIIPREDMIKHIRELTGRNDRLIAVVGASAVEGSLRGLLKKQMPNGPGKLFDPRFPLSTFSATIDVAYALGLIDPVVRRNANYIREIRNVFAHRIAPTSFRTKEVAAVCRLLALGRWEHRKNTRTNMRTRFLYAAIRTGSSIAVRAFSTDNKPASLL